MLDCTVLDSRRCMTGCSLPNAADCEFLVAVAGEHCESVWRRLCFKIEKHGRVAARPPPPPIGHLAPSDLKGQRGLTLFCLTVESADRPQGPQPDDVKLRSPVHTVLGWT